MRPTSTPREVQGTSQSPYTLCALSHHDLVQIWGYGHWHIWDQELESQRPTV